MWHEVLVFSAHKTSTGMGAPQGQRIRMALFPAGFFGAWVNKIVAGASTFLTYIKELYPYIAGRLRDSEVKVPAIEKAKFRVHSMNVAS